MGNAWPYRGAFRAACCILLVLLCLPLGAFAAGEEPQAPAVETPQAAEDSRELLPGDGFLAEVDKAEKELRKKTRASAGVFASAFSDQNKITIVNGGGFFTAVPAKKFDLHIQVMTGHIHQKETASRPKTDLWRTAVEASAENFFLTPQIVLWAAALYEQYDTQNNDPEFIRNTPFPPSSPNATYLRTDMYRSYLLGGRLGGKYIFENGSEAGLEGRRESIWSEHNIYDARLFNRVSDMTRLHADMAIDKARGFMDIVTFPEHQFRLEGGLDSFEDGNLRAWGYTHYQIPVLRSREKHWTVIRPNFYTETTEKEKPGYFTPEMHSTLGLALHTIQELDPFELELEVNPQLLWTDDDTKNGETATGINGLVNLTYKADSFRVGIGGFGYKDSDGYWLLRSTFFFRYFF